jgi:DNA-binding beta-propeller fold protein YncE
VIVYDADGTELTSWGEGLFERPHGITVTEDGSVYLVEDFGCAVRKFTLDGQHLMTFGPMRVHSDTGADWEDPDLLARVRSIRPDGGPPFNNPTRVAIGPTGDVYVSDGYNNCKVHRFNQRGELVHSWGRAGTGPGEFHLVHAVAIDPSQRVYIGDRENSRVQVYDLAGEFIEEWPDARRPHAVVAAPDGRIYVGEARVRLGRFTFIHGEAAVDIPARLTIRDQSGAIVNELSGDGGPVDPHGVAVDSLGNIFIADAGKLRKYVRN